MNSKRHVKLRVTEIIFSTIYHETLFYGVQQNSNSAYTIFQYTHFNVVPTQSFKSIVTQPSIVKLTYQNHILTYPPTANHTDTVAEWLRRWTRNPLGSARVGSNPTGVGIFTILIRNAGAESCKSGRR